MSPASFILHWLASHSEKFGVLVKQAEDELAVVNLAIGAGHAGVRSMCATSGGGFALMSEAIGMAGMIETPVVIVNVQRGGPVHGHSHQDRAGRPEPGLRRLAGRLSRASSSRPGTPPTASTPPSRP